ncbi:MAG TPA: type II toxin-antitoxin system RelE/ParE family toxin [Streptosporangiaceae bacterium]|nr:type II toxin-antitoxin system RelE/ParE family toxin [Streptosporangiaceae bacterium]
MAAAPTSRKNSRRSIGTRRTIPCTGLGGQLPDRRDQGDLRRIAPALWTDDRVHRPIPRSAWVRPQKLKARALAQLLRIRVAGEYRVLYTIDDDRLVVLVVDAGHRRRIYRQRLGRRVRTDTWPRSRGDATRWPDGCEIYQRRLFRSGCHNHAFHP